MILKYTITNDVDNTTYEIETDDEVQVDIDRSGKVTLSYFPDDPNADPHKIVKITKWSEEYESCHRLSQ